jgi:hypothetical protein
MYSYGENGKFVYQPKDFALNQTIEPVGRRLDKINPNNASIDQDTFILQQPRGYMNLKIKKTDVYTVSITDQTIKPATGGGTSPALLDNFDWIVDNFAQSKAINGIRIDWGNSSLESTRNDRNPWLVEVKSTQFDLEACKRYGLSPMAFSGIDQLDDVMSSGVLNGTDVNTIGYQNVLPTNNQQDMRVPFFDKQQTLSSQKRVQILGVKFTTTQQANGSPIPLTAQFGVNGYPNVWVPMNNGVLYYSENDNFLTGTYQIQVTEYLVDDFLTTPYQKNKTEKCIAVSPASFVTFGFQYDRNYIQNSLIQYGGKSSNPGGNIATCVRNPSQSQIEVETFDFSLPPKEGYSLKFLSWRPSRIEVPTFKLGSDKTSAQIVINDQTSDILSQYYLISALPEMWTGNINSALPEGTNVQQHSPYLPGDITECSIQVGQTTITDNIPLSELKKMSADLMKNPALADWVSNTAEYIRWQDSMVLPKLSRNKGCPFLLLDISKLSLLNSTDCLQQMPNVKYPVVQSVKITYKIQSPKSEIIWSDNNLPTYTPHVYKFYPYLYEQREGVEMKKTQLFTSFEEAARILNDRNMVDNRVPGTFINNSYVPQLDYSMIGSGWFEDVTDFFKTHGSTIAKALMGAVRLGESITRDIPHPYAQAANKGLDIVSNFAKSYGYGPGKKSDNLMQQMVHANRANKRANY